MTFCAVLALVLDMPASAQQYPNKPIKLVVPYAPGGPPQSDSLSASHDNTKRRFSVVLISTFLGESKSGDTPRAAARREQARGDERLSDALDFFIG